MWGDNTTVGLECFAQQCERNELNLTCWPHSIHVTGCTPMKTFISRLLMSLLLVLPLLAEGQASGGRIYAFPNGSQPKYEIRGNLIYAYPSGAQASYEIKGSIIYDYPNGNQPKYDIRGKYIYEYSKSSQPVYEIR
jgi:hypothetical protein